MAGTYDCSMTASIDGDNVLTIGFGNADVGQSLRFCADAKVRFGSEAAFRLVPPMSALRQ